ncbi:hypothetical protein [Caulobacter henricii]|uniref:Uncharacterized protein n=1 Tax=Caulobacter henricii TaxID=69395 RepID=A0A0P0NX69_9CAUL|nr:hypothetical protein [Caulobacter henricii]ALL12644.1 hypothetical protein AQ619_04320 [Caulobacter henricii]
MRSLVILAVLVSVASAARAEDTRESRYGPRPSRASPALSAASGYAGPILGWAGKQEPIMGRAASIQAPPVPTAPLNMRPPAQVQAFQPAAAPVAAQATMSEPWRNLRALPESGSPAPAPAPSAPPQRQTLAATAPQTVPSRLNGLPDSAQPPGLLPSMARTYSVGRQYGLQPDALPRLQPNGMVFIAPSEEAPRLKDDEPRHGSAEWMAQGARGREDADRGGLDGTL